MKTLTCMFTVLFLSCSALRADSPSETKKIFSKKEINNLAEKYLQNNAGVKNPVMVDIDGDGDFDILKFTSKGNVEYYKNTGTLEQPEFVLEDKHFDNYEVNSFLPKMLLPVFFADRDGDKDPDVFAVVKDGYDSQTLKQRYKTMYIENTMDLDHYTLITIILVLLIVALLIVILK